MNLSEGYKKRLSELAGVINANQTVLLRSKNDPKFRFEITANDTGRIVKTEMQAVSPYMEPVDFENAWYKFFFAVNIGKQLDYDVIRNVMKHFPELYVADIE